MLGTHKTLPANAGLNRQYLFVKTQMFKSSIRAMAAAGAAAIALGTIFAAKSEAAECFYPGKAQVCFETRGRNTAGNELWDVVIRNNYTTEYVQIICDGSRLVDWRSRGGGTATQVDSFARGFCAL